MGTAINKEDYILYILSNLEPVKSSKFYLNKLAFLIEFAYLFHNKGTKELSDLEYAAINYGPVINDYSDILAQMEKKGLISIKGNSIRLLTDKKIEVPDDVSLVALPLIKRYSPLSFSELSAISHLTDAYKITTKNEKVMGNVINKSLAELETFFASEEQVLLTETQLPKIDRKNLVKYEFGTGV